MCEGMYDIHGKSERNGKTDPARKARNMIIRAVFTSKGTDRMRNGTPEMFSFAVNFTVSQAVGNLR